MAERRMFAKTIVLSDAFLDMPLSARCLYFTYGMLADDDGFINSPKAILRQCGASEKDLQVLLDRKFLIQFDSGIMVIKHFRVNNYIQKDRYKETIYSEERKQLSLDDAGNYHCIHYMDTHDVYTQDRLGKVRLGNNNINIICAEQSGETAAVAPAAEKEPAVFGIPLNDGSKHEIYQTDIDNWKSLYPAVDVMQEIRNMIGWCESNPTRRKTKAGIKRFITNWLSRSQNSGGSKSSSKSAEGRNVDANRYQGINF